MHMTFLLSELTLRRELQFKDRWLSLSDNAKGGSSMQSKKGRKLRTLLRELSDDEDVIKDSRVEVPDDPQRPWLHDYNAYIDVLEQVPEGWTSIQWWGVSIESLCPDEMLILFVVQLKVISPCMGFPCTRLSLNYVFICVKRARLLSRWPYHHQASEPS